MSSGKVTEIKVEDKFQNYIQKNFDSNTLTIINEIIFYGIFIYYYYFGPIQDTQQTFKIVKYIIAILALRYLFNYITSYRISDKKQTTYFQLNGKVAIFTLLVLFLSLGQDNLYTTLAIIFSYALLSSAAKYGYTIDNIITVGITYFIVSLNLV